MQKVTASLHAITGAWHASRRERGDRLATADICCFLMAPSQAMSALSLPFADASIWAMIAIHYAASAICAEMPPRQAYMLADFGKMPLISLHYRGRRRAHDLRRLLAMRDLPGFGIYFGERLAATCCRRHWRAVIISPMGSAMRLFDEGRFRRPCWWGEHTARWRHLLLRRRAARHASKSREYLPLRLNSWGHTAWQDARACRLWHYIRRY